MTDEATSSCRLDGDTRVMEPVRVQSSRKKGWRKPENTVVVSRPSKWGNPHVVERPPAICTFKPGRRKVIEARRRMEAVAKFEIDLRNGRLPFTIEDVRRELRDKNLACWCQLPEPGQPDHCHAAVLLSIANGDDE